MGCFGVEEPLNDGDAETIMKTVNGGINGVKWGCKPDCSVKASWTEPESLADVLKEEITLYFPLKRNLCDMSKASLPSNLSVGDFTRLACWEQCLHQPRYDLAHQGSLPKGRSHNLCRGGGRVHREADQVAPGLDMSCRLGSVVCGSCGEMRCWMK